MKEKQSVFDKDLCNTFVSCNITFNNLRKPKFKQLIEKHTQYICPSRQTFDRQMLSLYTETIEKIKAKMSRHYFWLTVDETQDFKAREVVNH